MAYTITNLDAKLKSYMDASHDILISNAIFNADSTKYMNIQTEVKAAVPIVRFDNAITFANGKTCGFSAAGDTTFTNRLLTPAYIKIQKEWCDTDLLDTWANYEVNMAAGRENMPFEEKIVNNIVEKINAEVEKLIWQGDKTNGSGNMALQDGLLTLMAADITAGTLTNTVAHASTDTVYDKTKKAFLAIHDNVMDRSVIVMSPENYRKLVMELMEKNLYHYKEDTNEEMSLILPGTMTKIQAIAGMAGNNQIIALPFDEVYYGVDLTSDKEEFKMWYSDDNQKFRFNCKFAVAINYAFPENIVVVLAA
jgi:hypothetical protein